MHEALVSATTSSDQHVATSGHLPASEMSEKQQCLILSIIDFLSHSINDGIIREKDRGDLDVASAYTRPHFLPSSLTSLLPL
jgi:hypothetical protein